MKLKKELNLHIDDKMNKFQEEYSYWFKGGEYYESHKETDRYNEWKSFVKNIGENIFEITSPRIINDISRSYDTFNLEFQTTDNQFVNFWFNYYTPIQKMLRSGFSFELRYKPTNDFSFNWKEKSFPENFLQNTILPKIKESPSSHDYREILQAAKDNHLIYWIKRFDLDYKEHDAFTSKKVQNMLKNDTEGLSYFFLKHFNKMHLQFKPLADSLERNYSKFDEIFNEKKNEDLMYKKKIDNLTKKLFE